MTKPTILILVTVYLASILIVGLFGMQVGGLTENDIATITLTEDRIEFDKEKATLNITFKELEGGNNYTKYGLAVRAKPKGDLLMTITPFVQGENPNFSPTNSNLSISCNVKEAEDENSIKVTNQGSTFTISGEGNATIVFYSQDDSGIYMVIDLRVREVSQI